MAKEQQEKMFYFNVWVHPKKRGDDINYSLDIMAKNVKEAKMQVEGWLKKRSAITNDYREETLKARKSRELKETEYLAKPRTK